MQSNALARPVTATVSRHPVQSVPPPGEVRPAPVPVRSLRFAEPSSCPQGPHGAGCTALATRAAPTGNERRASGTSGRRRERPRNLPRPEPELLVVKFLYLSRLPSGWLQASQYQLSLHVGEDARSDPPARPGIYSTPLIPAGPPQAVPPEEAHLREQIAMAVKAMDGDSRAGDLECRFKSRVAVRLTDAGPGPAAGGPKYFRVDAWVLPTRLFGTVQAELFARAFVPIEAKYHRRACTWPMIDAAGNDIGVFLTCEFAFAGIPSSVKDLTARLNPNAINPNQNEVNLTWLPPGTAAEDRVVPILGYRVDSRCLGRKGSSGSMSPSRASWQHEGDVEPRQAGPLRFVVPNLKPDTMYLFRVCAVNEVGLSEPEEVEVKTGPCAPAGCGQPRLAGCNGPVLAVEWDAPMYDGGANLVAYRVWVRPFSATDASPDEWLEVGHVKHNPSGVQRAEIHTEDLDPSIGRYLCRVAAINEVGEMGPATADAVSLTLPNPCAVSRPTPATSSAHLALGRAPWLQSGGNLLTMTINEPGHGGKRKVTVPLFQDNVDELPFGLDGLGAQSLASAASASDGSHEKPSHELALPERLDATGYWPPLAPISDDSRQWYHKDAFPETFREREALVPFKATHYTQYTPPHDERYEKYEKEKFGKPYDYSEVDLLKRLLEEKRSLLEESLQNFQELTEQLQVSTSEALRLRHEEVEIEAAGYQAEVAVLSQKLGEQLGEPLLSVPSGGLAALTALTPF
ncbi:M-protein [Durusdinium trenchii]|uniref:Striated muscle n=1 Tax=Durusdinium trenchii TaxID=1381693 RepID=A0ABP0HEV6_9DINO